MPTVLHNLPRLGPATCPRNWSSLSPPLSSVENTCSSLEEKTVVGGGLAPAQVPGDVFVPVFPHSSRKGTCV